MVAGMARASRWRVDGGVFHLTHRCHNRAFLLKLALPSVGEHQSLLDIAPHQGVIDYFHVARSRSIESQNSSELNGCTWPESNSSRRRAAP